jgi:hypothetical protein
VCHRTVSGAPRPYKNELATLGFLQEHSAKNHWTIRCTTRLSSVPPDCLVHQRSNGYQHNGRLQTVPLTVLQCAAEVRTDVRGAPDTEQCLSSAAPDCPVPLEDKASNCQLLQNPNGWVTWLAHRTIRCAH